MAVLPEPGPPFGVSILPVLLERAAAPTAVLPKPAVLNRSAAAPNAVFWSEVLKRSAPAPVAVLKLPSVSLKSENQPTALFAEPVVRLKRAFLPFSRRERWITAVRRRDYRLRCRADSQQTEECEY
jgi:hypothetical protein